MSSKDLAFVDNLARSVRGKNILEAAGEGGAGKDALWQITIGAQLYGIWGLWEICDRSGRWRAWFKGEYKSHQNRWMQLVKNFIGVKGVCSADHSFPRDWVKPGTLVTQGNWRDWIGRIVKVENGRIIIQVLRTAESNVGQPRSVRMKKVVRAEYQLTDELEEVSVRDVWPICGFGVRGSIDKLTLSDLRVWICEEEEELDAGPVHQESCGSDSILDTVNEQVYYDEGWEMWRSLNDVGGKAIHVFSDGSVRLVEDKATYYWHIAREDDGQGEVKSVRSSGGAVSLPIGYSIASYRAEAMALASILTGLLCEIRFANVVIHTDSKANIDTWRKGFEVGVPDQLSEADNDIWGAIRRVGPAWNGRVSLEWVKAHCDRKKPWELLTFEQKGNVLADKGAERMYSAETEPCLFAPKMRWSLIWKGQVVTGKVAQFLKNLVKMSKAERYVRELGRKCGVDIWGRTCWDVVGSMAARWDVCHRVRMIKLVWGLVATAKVLARRGEEMVDGLPSCKLCGAGVPESHWHFMAECGDARMVELRKITFEKVAVIIRGAGIDERWSECLAAVWSPGSGGIFSFMVEEAAMQLVTDWGEVQGWEDQLIQGLRVALSQGRWSSCGVLDGAWIVGLKAAGVGDRMANSVARKVIQTMQGGLVNLWRLRCKLYHEVKIATGGPSKDDLLVSLRGVLGHPQFGEQRTLIMDNARGLHVSKLKKLLKKMADKAESMNGAGHSVDVPGNRAQVDIRTAFGLDRIANDRTEVQGLGENEEVESQEGVFNGTDRGDNHDCSASDQLLVSQHSLRKNRFCRELCRGGDQGDKSGGKMQPRSKKRKHPNNCTLSDGRKRLKNTNGLTEQIGVCDCSDCNAYDCDCVAIETALHAVDKGGLRKRKGVG
jgi:ribonuclease HI